MVIKFLPGVIFKKCLKFYDLRKYISYVKILLFKFYDLKGIIWDIKID